LRRPSGIARPAAIIAGAAAVDADASLPEEELLPDVAPPVPPELPDDWAIAEVARLSASAGVASIFKIMSITSGCSSLQR
jgi:hypothetical protein